MFINYYLRKKIISFVATIFLQDYRKVSKNI